MYDNTYINHYRANVEFHCLFIEDYLEKWQLTELYLLIKCHILLVVLWRILLRNVSTAFCTRRKEVLQRLTLPYTGRSEA